MRRILTGIFILAAAAAASAQTPSKRAQVAITNAPPGINIDIFMDGGKVQTAVVTPQGTSEISLDFLSLGKPQAQVYIETCRDGQRVHIISDGTNVPTEEGCNRRPVGAPFGLNCGKLTLNWSQLGIKVACGSITRNPYVWGGALVTLGGGVALTAGGGGGSSAVSTQPTPPVTVVPPLSTNQSTPVATPTPPVQTPTPTTTTPAIVPESGTYAVTGCQVGADPFNEERVIGLCQARQFTISASGGGASISGPPLPSGIGGTLSADFSLTVNGRINTVGTGTPATWDTTLKFTASKAITVTISVTVNVGGSNRTIPYSLTAAKP
jgi:hypothetical protein